MPRRDARPAKSSPFHQTPVRSFPESYAFPDPAIDRLHSTPKGRLCGSNHAPGTQSLNLEICLHQHDACPGTPDITLVIARARAGVWLNNHDDSELAKDFPCLLDRVCTRRTLQSACPAPTCLQQSPADKDLGAYSTAGESQPASAEAACLSRWET